MDLGSGPGDDILGTHAKRQKKKSHFKKNPLHKAMVRTAWKALRQADAIFWVVDAWKCARYGDFLPEVAELDGVAIGPPVKDAWWTHPELAEELAIIRKFRRVGREVHVILNKMDRIEAMGIGQEEFALGMREQLTKDLGNIYGTEQPILRNLWPTSVAHDPDSLNPLRKWLCTNMPMQSPIYPLDAVSDVPARVLASEIVREKLFEVLNEELPYSLNVVTAVWREGDDGTLRLGLRVIIRKPSQAVIARGCLRKIANDAEDEISEAINFGRPVQLHFQIAVEPDWMTNQAYYEDVQGLLSQQDSLMYLSA